MYVNACSISVFGENLPERFFERLYDLRRADLLLVMGTSLKVQPFASLIDEVPLNCPRALLNLERVGESRHDHIFTRFGSAYGEGFDFDSERTRDMFCGGAVDDTVRLIARECDWEEELDKLHAQMHQDVDRLHPKLHDKAHSPQPNKVSVATRQNESADALADKLQATHLRDKEKL